MKAHRCKVTANAGKMTACKFKVTVHTAKMKLQKQENKQKEHILFVIVEA